MRSVNICKRSPRFAAAELQTIAQEYLQFDQGAVTIANYQEFVRDRGKLHKFDCPGMIGN